ncbi:hypothetical protein BDR03DRAFT_968144 [Suillus americanus]|nr:hypothetical protein BDR03DRAFT_968144 [Suillus americanus]
MSDIEIRPICHRLLSVTRPILLVITATESIAVFSIFFRNTLIVQDFNDTDCYY